MMHFCEKIKNSYFVQNYGRIYPYVKPYLFRAVLSMLLTLPLGAMDAVIAWALKPYMDVVMIEKTAGTVSLIPIVIILFSLTQSILNYTATYLNTWVGKKITMDLKYDLFLSLMHNDPVYFDHQTSGNVIYHFNNDADAACSGLLTDLKRFATRLFSSISLIFVLIWNSWQLSILAIVVLFGALYPLSTVRRKIKDLTSLTVASGAKVITHYNEAFIGNRVITSYNLYDYQKKRFRETLKGVFKLGIKMTQRTGILSPMMHFIVSLGIAAVIWLGSFLIAEGKLTPGGFVSFITALIMLYTPIKSLGSNFASVQFSLMAMERVFKRLDAVPTITNNKDAIMLENIKEGITYENVCFSYIKKIPVLSDINLTIKKGQTIAFVGNSGGGKSTLVHLLPRFYDVTSGAIKIDSHNIKDYDLYSLRDQIAIVFQDNILFEGSIKDNILLGNKEASDAQLKQAVSSACLDEFISTLKDGINTQIGERGVLLSGGQRQRIAIARAFIKNAPIVILDEATSALDNKSEAVVQKAIENLMKDRTVLIIAHRLSTIKNADKIVVIDHGKICEEGTHEELLEKPNSVYASLYKAQLQ